MSVQPELLSSIADECRLIRHELHSYPEIGWEEVRTGTRVVEALTTFGVDNIERICGTGVVATIKGREPGNRTIGLRSDLDALPILEATGLPYKSTRDGVMHACGHDGHTAMLLGAAKYLSATRDFSGQVHLIFQPAEEGRGGARKLVNEGLFDRFPCDSIYGMHNYPGVPAGQFVIRPGAFMAGVNRWWVSFRAKGGHGGGGHHKTADLPVTQAQFILALQTIVSRNVPAIDTCVISVGHISAGSYWTGSILPSELVVAGTARSFTPHITKLLDERIPELARGIAKLNRCECEIEMRWLAPPLVNDSECTDRAIAAAQRTVGVQSVQTNFDPTAMGEDFAEMMAKVPGAVIFIGNGNSEDLHSDKYVFNDEIISNGVRYWVELVHEELSARG